jgi:hypothetical protein
MMQIGNCSNFGIRVADHVHPMCSSRRIRNVNTDGALGWTPDFPAEEAGHVVGKFFRSSPPSVKLAAGKALDEMLAARAPEWADLLRRVMNDFTKG